MEGVKENMREEKRRKYNRNKDDLIEEKQMRNKIKIFELNFSLNTSKRKKTKRLKKIELLLKLKSIYVP